jgi:hypothetical protein
MVLSLCDLRFVIRVDVLQRPRASGADLDNGLLLRVNEVFRPRWHGYKPTGVKAG